MNGVQKTTAIKLFDSQDEKNFGFFWEDVKETLSTVEDLDNS
ncbi:MAG: hypothetical protein R3E32_00580 [Chitinophagales bacterium]